MSRPANKAINRRAGTETSANRLEIQMTRLGSMTTKQVWKVLFQGVSVVPRKVDLSTTT